jgi:predicted phage-related endonuclease
MKKAKEVNSIPVLPVQEVAPVPEVEVPTVVEPPVQRLSDVDILSKIHLIKKMDIEAAKLKTEIEALKGTIKDEMVAREVDKMTVDIFKLSYVKVITKRFDSNNFKKDYPKLYDDYAKDSESMRFDIR